MFCGFFVFLFLVFVSFFYNKHLYCSGSVNDSSGYLAAGRLEGAISSVPVVCALSAAPPPAARPPLPAGGIPLELTYSAQAACFPSAIPPPATRSPPPAGGILLELNFSANVACTPSAVLPPASSPPLLADAIL
jgi:hypothetical protein